MTLLNCLSLGTVSIEATLSDGSSPEPIHTFVSQSRATRPMTFPLDAATSVKMYGERFLHGWVSQEFSNQSGFSLQLQARTRQFSSFIMLLGRIAGPDKFDPKQAILIQVFAIVLINIYSQYVYLSI